MESLKFNKNLFFFPFLCRFCKIICWKMLGVVEDQIAQFRFWNIVPKYIQLRWEVRSIRCAKLYCHRRSASIFDGNIRYCLLLFQFLLFLFVSVCARIFNAFFSFLWAFAPPYIFRSCLTLFVVRCIFQNIFCWSARLELLLTFLGLLRSVVLSFLNWRKKVRQVFTYREETLSLTHGIIDLYFWICHRYAFRKSWRFFWPISWMAIISVWLVIAVFLKLIWAVPLFSKSKFSFMLSNRRSLKWCYLYFLNCFGGSVLPKRFFDCRWTCSDCSYVWAECRCMRFRSDVRTVSELLWMLEIGEAFWIPTKRNLFWRCIG